MEGIHLGGGFILNKDIELKGDLIVGSKLHLVAKQNGEFNIGSDFLKALSEKVHVMVLNAQYRSKQRGGKTLKASDL